MAHIPHLPRISMPVFLEMIYKYFDDSLDLVCSWLVLAGVSETSIPYFEWATCLFRTGPNTSYMASRRIQVMSGAHITMAASSVRKTTLNLLLLYTQLGLSDIFLSINILIHTLFHRRNVFVDLGNCEFIPFLFDKSTQLLLITSLPSFYSLFKNSPDILDRREIRRIRRVTRS